METFQVVLDLVGIVTLGWLATAVMLWLMGGSLPWPYPRQWRWGSASLEAAYVGPGDRGPKPAQGVPEPLERRLARVDWLDHKLRLN
jgi:hypothetical protein